METIILTAIVIAIVAPMILVPLIRSMREEAKKATEREAGNRFVVFNDEEQREAARQVDLMSPIRAVRQAAMLADEDVCPEALKRLEKLARTAERQSRRDEFARDIEQSEAKLLDAQKRRAQKRRESGV